MEKRKWPGKVANEVLECIGENRTLLNNIQCKKVNWNGPFLSRNCFLHDAIEGQIKEEK